MWIFYDFIFFSIHLNCCFWTNSITTTWEICISYKIWLTIRFTTYHSISIKYSKLITFRMCKFSILNIIIALRFFITCIKYINSIYLFIKIWLFTKLILIIYILFIFTHFNWFYFYIVIIIILIIIIIIILLFL